MEKDDSAGEGASLLAAGAGPVVAVVVAVSQYSLKEQIHTRCPVGQLRSSLDQMYRTRQIGHLL